MRSVEWYAIFLLHTRETHYTLDCTYAGYIRTCELRTYKGYAEDVPMKNVKLQTHASAMVDSQSGTTNRFCKLTQHCVRYTYTEKRCFDSTRWNVVECR